MKKFNISAFLFIFFTSNNSLLSSETVDVSVILQDQIEEAIYNREKRNIEKNLRECLEKNIGEELSELNVPKVCAEFVRKFINMYGIDEFSKKVCAYDAMCKADRALSKNQ